MTTARPLLMAAPMVRSTIKGRKTQTRRIAKFVPLREEYNLSFSGLEPMEIGANAWALGSPTRSSWEEKTERTLCPHGKAGDLLWVRETWAITDNVAGCDTPWPDRPHIKLTPDLVDRAVIWAADGHWNWSDGDGFSSERSFWKPSIHMPRKYSRLTLEITDVRVERLQDISKSDAEAEGIEYAIRPFGDWKLIPGIWDFDGLVNDGEQRGDPPPAIKYAYLWNSINAKAGTRWADNPWVWVLTFAVHHANVDAVLAQRAEVAA